jgi:hypothetical protein
MMCFIYIYICVCVYIYQYAVYMMYIWCILHIYLYISVFYATCLEEVMIHQRYVASSYLQSWIINLWFNKPFESCRVLIPFNKDLWNSFQVVTSSHFSPLWWALAVATLYLVNQWKSSYKFLWKNWICQLISAPLISSCSFYTNYISFSLG